MAAEGSAHLHPWLVARFTGLAGERSTGYPPAPWDATSFRKAAQLTDYGGVQR